MNPRRRRHQRHRRRTRKMAAQLVGRLAELNKRGNFAAKSYSNMLFPAHFDAFAELQANLEWFRNHFFDPSPPREETTLVSPAFYARLEEMAEDERRERESSP